MGVKKEVLPFDDVARLNEHGEMVKFLAAPLIVLAAVVALIVIVRLVQRARDRQLTERFLRD
jgi:hypothetical protein